MTKRIISTPAGRIAGEEKETCVIYKSVPYAITERFENPKEIEPWDLFDATAKPKNCHQRFEYVDESKEGGFYYKEFDGWRDSDYVESPMTLTIVTPKEELKDCPVLCYVHGGSYENGHSEDCPFGDSDEYSKRGIILVSIGYRLNVFGLYDSGNYCLKDIIFAVKWVKKKIAGFGGNPDKITLMGQSAGAMAVYNVLLSNQLDGVISSAVMCSGAGILPKIAVPKTKEENHWFWQELMQKCGCDTLEQLKSVDHQLLWQSWYDLKAEKGNLAISVPAIDREVLKDYPSNIVKEKKDQNIPLMVGVTSQDMFPFMIFDLALSVGKARVKNKQADVYGYFFDVELPGNSYKAFHASDLWYWFGNFAKSWRPFDESDRNVSQMMIDYLANFIKTQNPNGDNLELWKPISKKNHHFRWLHKGNESMISPFLARKKLLHSTFKDKGPF